MFVANDVELGVPFVTARPRLVELIVGRALADASRAAFDEGLAQLAQPADLVQPDRPSPARLMRVRSLRPAHGPDRVTAALRWEAIGAPGGLFPVLDADLTLTPTSPQATRMSLAGVYRPPFGYLNIELDPATTGRVAGTTVRALLRAAAVYLAGPGANGATGSLPRAAEAP
jgi:hypothetical protein